MSLTHEQHYLLEELKEYFVRVEKIAAKNRIELDAMISDYSDSGFSDIVAEKVSIQEKAKLRRSLFEDTSKEEKAVNKSH